MSTNQARPDASAGILASMLPNLGSSEIDTLLAALDVRAPSTVKLLGEEHESIWFNVVAALVNKLVRSTRMAQNAVERARATAAMATVRATLAGRRRELAHNIVAASEFVASTELNDVETGIKRVYELILQRTPGPAEIDIWKANLGRGMPFHQFLLGVDHGEEAKRIRGGSKEDSDGDFVQTAYEIILGRCAHPRDIDYWCRMLKTNATTRQGILTTLFGFGKGEDACLDTGHDGLSCMVMGTNKIISVDDWAKRASELKMADRTPNSSPEPFTRFYIKTQPRVLVSAIASLYKGADFIEQFLDNITSQTVFDEYCELVIIDADSPDNEAEVIRRYMSKHRNIQYLRMNYRIGIYDAWNVGVKAARGDYLTNTNLDDLRRRDSLELQAAVLDNLDFVDVTYQDFYYSFDPALTPEEIALFGYKSQLPVVTPYNMIAFNSPHNAPMWRKRLHEELGMFDANYKSAGDYEFWMRCLAAGKTFFKLNEPHVVYYQNPHGLSTRADTRGVVEGRNVHRKYSRKLISPNITSELQEFGKSALGLPEAYAATLRGEVADRYALAQSELRQLARVGKFGQAA